MQQTTSAGLTAFLKRWLVTTVGVLVAAQIVPGIHYDTAGGLIFATLLLGVLNAVVRPIMVVLSLPLLILSLGLFLVVINALLLYWVGQMKTFHVDSFGSAILGSLVISVVSLILNAFIGNGSSRVRDRRPAPPPAQPPPRRDDGQGPIIDV